ncbi:MAG: hypothetical protein WBF17_27330 [Phycisphaerae bacterium]
MLPEWLMALLVLLRERWSTRRDAHVRFLKLQVEILRSRLPGNRVIPDPVERRQLLKAGAEVDHAVEDTLGIVSVKTYRRWLREERGGRDPGKVGRPHIPKSLRELIVRLSYAPTMEAQPHRQDLPRRHCRLSRWPTAAFARRTAPTGDLSPARHSGPPPCGRSARVTPEQLKGDKMKLKDLFL